MYLTNIITKKEKDVRVENILSHVLKIKKTKKNIQQSDNEKDIVKFLSEQMVKEVRKALK